MVFPHGQVLITLRDFWTPDNLSEPIIIKEALVLLNTLSASIDHIFL